MRIDPRLLTQTSDVAATARKREADALKTPLKTAPAADLALSSAAEALQKFGPAVKAGPAVRAEKVSELREAVQDGSYQPKGSDVAGAILERGGEQIDVDQLRGR